MYQELEKIFLLKLKTILQSKYFYLIIILFTLVYVFYKNKILLVSKYNGTEQSIFGTINTLKIDGNKLSIELLAKEKIIVNYYIKDELELEYIKNNYKIGLKVILTGNLVLPQENTVFNLFNYRKYLQSKKIYWLFNAKEIKKINNKISLKYLIKNKVIDKINANKENSDYFYTFILGDDSYIDADVLDSYQSNGISHLFAVSGMHITLFSTIILFLLNKISKNKFFNYLIVISFLILYAFFTNYTPSLVRAILLFILCIINNSLNLKIKTINLLILVCSFMLLYNPFYIYNLGFIFSFTVTFYLIIFSDIVNSKKNCFSKLLSTSLIAFLASIPISINNFFCINLLSIVFNLIFVGFVSFIIFPLSLITFIFSFFNPLLSFFIGILESISLCCSKINFLNITLCYMNFYIFIGYYFLITIILNFIKKNNYLCLIILLIVIFIHHNILWFNNSIIITMIDVGQGDSILISLPHNKGNILIDTGGIVNYQQEWAQKKNDYSIALNKIIPYAKSIGVKQFDLLILSHGDFDHIGESINLVNNFKVGTVIFNCGELNELENNLINILNKNNVPYYSCISKLNVDDQKLYFLNTSNYDNENDNSNIIYTTLNKYKFLFMGDASSKVEENILKKYNLKDIDVLKVGHHGSKTSSGKVFIDKINPKYSIISVGKNNRYGHPNNETLENLNKSKIYRTDIYGSILIKIKNNSLKLETCIS